MIRVLDESSQRYLDTLALDLKIALKDIGIEIKNTYASSFFDFKVPRNLNGSFKKLLKSEGYYINPLFEREPGSNRVNEYLSPTGVISILEISVNGSHYFVVTVFNNTLETQIYRDYVEDDYFDVYVALLSEYSSLVIISDFLSRDREHVLEIEGLPEEYAEFSKRFRGI